MNVQRYVIGSLVVFAFFCIAEWLVHGVILKGWYAEGQVMLRAGGMFGGKFIWMLIGSLILTFGFCLIFTYGYQNRGVAEGFRFGLIMGITFGVAPSLVKHAVYPVPGGMAVAWAIGYLIEMILAGMIIAAIYSPKKAASAP